MADPKTLNLVVITPDRKVLETRVASVVIPLHDGELGVLHDRAPLMCELGIGQLRYTSGGSIRRVFIDGGFAQVHENEVTVLSRRAVPTDQITPELVAAAEQSVTETDGTDPESRTRHEAAQQRARVLRSLKRS